MNPLAFTPHDVVEFVILAALAGWALGIATYGVITEIERWIRTGGMG